MQKLKENTTVQQGPILQQGLIDLARGYTVTVPTRHTRGTHARALHVHLLVDLGVNYYSRSIYVVWSVSRPCR